MGFFDGTNKIPAAGGSSRFKPGIYPAIRIDKIQVKDGYNGLRYIVEGTVVAEPERTTGDPTPLGASGSWTVQLDGKWADLGKAEAKAFAAAVLGLSREQADATDMEAHLEASCGPSQPWIGKLVRTQAEEKRTKGGHVMVKHVWWPVEDPSVVDAEAMRTPARAPEAAAAPIPAVQAPAPPAVAPPAPTAGLKDPPAGWFHFPEGDPRRGVQCYNAAGQVQAL